MLENVEGGMTKYVPFSDVMPIYGATMRIDTIDEVAYYRHGGILHCACAARNGEGGIADRSRRRLSGETAIAEQAMDRCDRSGAIAAMIGCRFHSGLD